MGEHGPHLVPLWSTVSIQGFTPEEERYAIKRIREKESDSEEALEKVLALLCDEGVEAAFAKVDTLPFDIRPIVRPFITHYTGSKTIVGPAATTCDLIGSMLREEKLFSTCQVKVEGEFYGLYGVFGVPVILNRRGIEEIHKIPLWEEELEKLKEAVKVINEGIRSLG